MAASECGHLYVDALGGYRKVHPLINNAKTQAPSVCNALDTVLVHRSVVSQLLPAMTANLNASGVKVLCDEPSLQALGGAPGIVADLVAPGNLRITAKSSYRQAFGQGSGFTRRGDGPHRPAMARIIPTAS
jgi:gamma-glutamyl phosphate reductase